MKPTLRKGAVLLASAMVISSAAPATGYVYAAKNFTYAYQTGGIVDKLSLEQGDVVDLRFHLHIFLLPEFFPRHEANMLMV